MSIEKTDHGQHYRFAYNGINLDPFRICQIYHVNDFALQTIIKKALCAGGRGHKDFRQDLLDIICAAERRIEMLDEDDVQEPLPCAEPKEPTQPTADNLPWIKNTGTQPDCKKVLAKRKDGEYCDENNLRGLDWEVKNDIFDIIEYLILE
jgi:hypothetical protein